MKYICRDFGIELSVIFIYLKPVTKAARVIQILFCMYLMVWDEVADSLLIILPFKLVARQWNNAARLLCRINLTAGIVKFFLCCTLLPSFLSKFPLIVVSWTTFQMMEIAFWKLFVFFFNFPVRNRHIFIFSFSVRWLFLLTFHLV